MKRITPADAGKTGLSLPNLHKHEDHPRGCGENFGINSNFRLCCGSPPRMRGKPKRLMVDSFGDRITPADAGKTISVSPFAPAATDHPRGCGENVKFSLLCIAGVGSPPRMRGKRKNPLAVYSRYRITPADAGKTTAASARTLAAKDHPRGCGENGVFPIFAPHFIGSPPRMRGKLHFAHFYRFIRGITPADAGKTATGPVCKWL